MNMVLQPHPLIVLGLNVWMGTDAGANDNTKSKAGVGPGDNVVRLRARVSARTRGRVRRHGAPLSNSGFCRDPLRRGGLNVIRKEAWLFCRTSPGVRLCWELEEPRRPKKAVSCSLALVHSRNPQCGVVHHKGE